MKDDASMIPDWATFVRNLREQHGITQKDFAEKTGLTVFTLRNIEAGGIPNGPAAAAIRKFVESMPVDDLSLPKVAATDQVSRVLMGRVFKHIVSLKRTEGFAKNIISRRANGDQDKFEAYSWKMFQEYITEIEDESQRHDILLQLMDVGTNGK